MTDQQAIDLISAIQKVVMNIGAEGGGGQITTDNIAAIKAAFVAATGGAITPAANVVALTDNSGGSATSTLALIASGTPADLAAQGVINGVVKNAIASLAAKTNAEIAALKAAGLQATS